MIGYKKRLVEVDEVLEHLSEENLSKIPLEIRQAIKENKDKNYVWKYDETKELKDQGLSKDTIAILAYLNSEYLLNEEQKKIIEEEIVKIYDNIKLPKRATIGSAGYDFYAPLTFTLKPNETILIPTGIKVEITPGWFLGLFPRSGLGFKYRLQLNNTVGIIDSDYYFAENEGHIMIKLTNDSNENKTLGIIVGQGFAQGIFIPYGIVVDDDTNTIRVGGMGSTTK